MKRRLLIVGVLLVVAVFGFGPTVRASITYDLYSYPADQAGYALTGWITTDGTLGAIHTSDIQAWAFTLSNGVQTFHGASTTPYVSSVKIGGTLLATPTALLLPMPAVGDGLQSNGLNLADGGVFLNWTRISAPYSIAPAPTQEYYCTFLPWTPFDTVNPGMNGTNPWLLAGVPSAVPEPASVLVWAGLLGMGGIVAYRRRSHATVRSRMA